MQINFLSFWFFKTYKIKYYSSDDVTKIESSDQISLDSVATDFSLDAGILFLVRCVTHGT